MAAPTDKDKGCPACHRLLPTTTAADAAPILLPPFEHMRARSGSISARRGSVGAASKIEWQKLRTKLDPNLAERRHSLLRAQPEEHDDDDKAEHGGAKHFDHARFEHDK